MSNNSDENTRVSAEQDGSVPTTVDSPGSVVPEAERASEPAPHLVALLKQAEDEAAGLKDAWLRAKAETENVRKQAQNDIVRTHKYAIERFAAGEKYDPHRHQAMTMIESDQRAGTVVQVFQKGYLLNDRVLRPALVAVAKAAEAPPASPGETGR